MKNNFIRSSIALGCLVLAIGFLLAPKVRGAAGGSSQTADNILIGLNGSPDNFGGNDHNVCNYADTAPFYMLFSGIAEADDYQVHVTGTVKSNPAVADEQFSVTSGGGGSVTVNGCNSPIPETCPQ